MIVYHIFIPCRKDVFNVTIEIDYMSYDGNIFDLVEQSVPGFDISRLENFCIKEVLYTKYNMLTPAIAYVELPKNIIEFNVINTESSTMEM